MFEPPVQGQPLRDVRQATRGAGAGVQLLFRAQARVASRFGRSLLGRVASRATSVRPGCRQSANHTA